MHPNNGTRVTDLKDKNDAQYRALLVVGAIDFKLVRLQANNRKALVKFIKSEMQAFIEAAADIALKDIAKNRTCRVCGVGINHRNAQTQFCSERCKYNLKNMNKPAAHDPYDCPKCGGPLQQIEQCDSDSNIFATQFVCKAEVKGKNKKGCGYSRTEKPDGK